MNVATRSFILVQSSPKIGIGTRGYRWISDDASTRLIYFAKFLTLHFLSYRVPPPTQLGEKLDPEAQEVTAHAWLAMGDKDVVGDSVVT